MSEKTDEVRRTGILAGNTPKINRFYFRPLCQNVVQLTQEQLAEK